MFWYKCVVILYVVFFVFFFKQKTAYEMRISDWSSDVCSSDLARRRRAGHAARPRLAADRAADRRPGRADDPASRRQPFAVRAAARGLAGLGILPPSRRSRGGVAEALVLGDPGGAADPSAARRPHRLRYPAAVAAAAATGDVVERVHHRPAVHG